VEKTIFSLERKPDGSFHGFEWNGTAVLHSENKNLNPEELCESFPAFERR
jgi:hypothetical protein